MNTRANRVRTFTTILALTVPLIGLTACTGNDDTIDLGKPSGALSETPSISATGSGGALALSPESRFASIGADEEGLPGTFYSTSTGGTSGSELINTKAGSVYTTASGENYTVIDVRTYGDWKRLAEDTVINEDVSGRLVITGQDDGENQPYVVLIAQRVSE